MHKVLLNPEPSITCMRLVKLGADITGLVNSQFIRIVDYLLQVKREHGKFYQKENPRKISKNFELGPNGSTRTSLLGPTGSSKTCLKASSSINQDDASSSSSPPIVKVKQKLFRTVSRMLNGLVFVQCV